MVHFIYFPSTTTAGTPDVTLGKRKIKKQFNCPSVLYLQLKWDEMADHLPQEEKADDEANDEAHQGLAACWHCPHSNTDFMQKQVAENIWIALFKYLVLPEEATAIQSWQGSN